MASDEVSDLNFVGFIYSREEMQGAKGPAWTSVLLCT
jgi:hypothetical protein